MVAVAIAGAAVVGAGASMAASSKASKAANNAADKNNALEREIYNQNLSNETPFLNRGNAAGENINALLGLGGSGPSITGYTPAQSVPGARYGEDYAYSGYGGQNDNSHTVIPGQPIYSPGTSAQSAQNAFAQYRGSTGYQFRMDEGMKAANTGYAARSLLQSGAALKGLNTYAQGAASDEFGRYLGQLQQQQQVGVGAANALAGAGSAFVNGVSSNNNSAASATGNAALASANAINGGIGNALSAYGTYAGLRSSYGGASGQANPYGIRGVGGDGIY